LGAQREQVDIVSNPEHGVELAAGGFLFFVEIFYLTNKWNIFALMYANTHVRRVLDLASQKRLEPALSRAVR